MIRPAEAPKVRSRLRMVACTVAAGVAVLAVGAVWRLKRSPPPKPSPFPKWIRDISVAVAQNYLATQRYGSGFDSLLTIHGRLYEGLVPACAQADQMVVTTLTDADVAALASTGIIYVYPMVLTTNAT